jgi:hypothetical protein
MQKCIYGPTPANFESQLNPFLEQGWKVVPRTFIMNTNGCICIIQKELYYNDE